MTTRILTKREVEGTSLPVPTPPNWHLVKVTCILTKREVIERTSLSAPTIWRLVKAGKFPASLQLSPGRVGWRESDVERWLSERAGVAK